MYEPDFYGDAKCDLIDFLCEVYDYECDYSQSPIKLIIKLCQIFKIKSASYLGKSKAKKILTQFLLMGSFDKESFGYALSVNTRLADQKDIMKAKQALGNDEYHKLLGDYKGSLSKVDEIVLANSNVFYQSPEWQRLRYQALRVYKNFCQCCGRKRSEKLSLHVDHIIPRSIRPELALELSNLQILCEDCNMGKFNVDGTDWRDDDSYESLVWIKKNLKGM